MAVVVVLQKAADVALPMRSEAIYYQCVSKDKVL
jgi:hypothetical protein